jgi:signal transduction histidine kinase
MQLSRPPSSDLIQRWERFIRKDRSPQRRYGAAAAIAIALIGLDSIMPFNPNAALTVACMTMLAVWLASIYGGLGPGLLVGMMGDLSADYYFVPPVGHVLGSREDYLVLAVYLLVAVLMSLMASSMRAAYQGTYLAKENAQNATQARENVLAVVSHDLRNMLSTISLISRVLPVALESKTELSRHLVVMDRTIHQMNRLIQDLLDAARIDSANFSIHPQNTDLATLIAESVESLKNLAAEKEIALELDISGEVPRIAADPDRIAQVIVNLVSNAIKFTPRQGKVRLQLQPKNQEVSLSVRDSGPGIPLEAQSRVFTRNWQAKETASLGAGLGLYIAQGIVHAHGGQIGFTSQKGQGSTFYFTLPVHSVGAI